MPPLELRGSTGDRDERTLPPPPPCQTKPDQPCGSVVKRRGGEWWTPVCRACPRREVDDGR